MYLFLLSRRGLPAKEVQTPSQESPGNGATDFSSLISTLKSEIERQVAPILTQLQDLKKSTAAQSTQQPTKQQPQLNEVATVGIIQNQFLVGFQSDYQRYSTDC